MASDRQKPEVAEASTELQVRSCAIKPIFNKGPSLGVRTFLLILVSLVAVLAYLYTDWFDSLKDKTTDISLPFYWTADLPNRVEEWADNRLMSRSRLEQENTTLRSEILIHRRKLQQMASLAAENARLRQLLNSAETLEDRVIVGELIGISPDVNTQKVIVNRGSDHGVYVGQAMLDAKGLMGQVVEVGSRSSRVLLITDSTHALPVQVNRNGVRLIAEGVGNPDLFLLSLRYVSNTTDVQEGDLLVSSGLGGRFPEGYPVAEVTKVDVDTSQQFVRVLARPMAEMNRSRHVLLVFDTPPGEGPLGEAELLGGPESGATE